jgi:hypothetical protein
MAISELALRIASMKDRMPRGSQGMYDGVLCNNDLFGEHRGEKHQTKNLNPSFPGDTYEITSSGRLELLESTF